MARKKYAAEFKFERLGVMNGMIDSGGADAGNAAKSKRKMNDSWMRRNSTNVRGFYDPKKAGAV